MTVDDRNVHIVVEEWGPTWALRYRPIEAHTDPKTARESADEFNKNHKDDSRVRDVWVNIKLVGEVNDDTG